MICAERYGFLRVLIFVICFIFVLLIAASLTSSRAPPLTVATLNGCGYG
jgi:hypothetical protein